MIGQHCLCGVWNTKIFSLKKLKNGDLICFKNSGAYCFSMSSNYNSRVKPAEVCLVNNEIKLIRKRETIKNILENQIDIFENNCW